MPSSTETASAASPGDIGAGPPDAQARRVAISPDGYRYDEDTGEILGHVEEAEPGFRIITPEGADWVLQKMQAEELELRKIEQKRAALLANLDAMAVEPRNRLAWLHRRFDAELQAQAERDLAAQGGRSKTAKYPHGKVAKRATAGSAEVTDPRAAVEYVAEWAPDHVKRSVGIEGVKAAIAAEREQIGDEELLTDTGSFFRAAEPSERWTIDTGLGKEARR